jgi:hypothetical protein
MKWVVGNEVKRVVDNEVKWLVGNEVKWVVVWSEGWNGGREWGGGCRSGWWVEK